MEFLGIGPLELLVIILLVLIIISPKDLAKGAKAAGRWINQLNKSDTWKSLRRVSQEMQNLPNRLAREAQLDELKELQEGIGLDEKAPAEKPSPAPRMPPAGDPVDGRRESPELGPAGSPKVARRAVPAARGRASKSPSIPVAVESGKRTPAAGRSAGKGSRKSARRTARPAVKKPARGSTARPKPKTRKKKS
jgi:Sec-independent protein translocase protein TatA